MDRMQYLSNALYRRGFDLTFRLNVLSYMNTPIHDATTRLINSTPFAQLEQIEWQKWAHTILMGPMGKPQATN
ncbi:hypothetical protein YH66_07190 [[Brevibacterium] flavum]|uniref:Uncharacterized protein n=2 Tax=Corynebacterium TaxID=1716 RepID=A0A0F6Z5Q4_9CORY|nr:hypothetical protein C624_07595 [Corynebacterium glutamicum SCgG1]AGN22121.1 hypothetical protein C629_07605 [Corynebacterium glutamicum SCgG2]AKF27347.1 hypothetical protein YH66_07190 [[Brevibacterium] flavum]AMA00025.1 hypothetical protein APT58_07155 [Corynebacterium glutamicum]AST20596.1 hypothetical protein CEY17_07310 [Corynebacterium glutamicum ATCC 14067]EGV39131.1 hypothetical protein CgS9114_14667 [Corynebacterium glutamicum S9114]EOA63826.1 hypothetical protein J433_12452 [Cory